MKLSQRMHEISNAYTSLSAWWMERASRMQHQRKFYSRSPHGPPPGATSAQISAKPPTTRANARFLSILAFLDDELDLSRQRRKRFPDNPRKSPNTVNMGRMHSKGKGISSSALPYSRAAPAWLKTTPDQVVDQICKLAKKGATPSQIGVVLRDSHGVAQVKIVTGMLENETRNCNWKEKSIDKFSQATRSSVSSSLTVRYNLRERKS